MKQITFKDTYTLGKVVAENDNYRHVHYPEMLIMYDANFIEFKNLPSLTEFKETEKYLKEYHQEKGQEHVKFYFPTDVKLTEELTDYLTGMGYDLGFMELYSIQPGQFPTVKKNPDIEIQVVTERNLETLLELHHQSDIKIGGEFAKQKSQLIKRQFEDQNFLQILAFYKGCPAGYVDVIVSKEIIEIQNLNVLEVFQKKGIGSNLQKFVMDLYPDKILFLVADGEDTPKEMYKKQNYQYLECKYEAQRLIEN